MLTQTGMQILSDLYSVHRNNYIERNPGCNENDCERDFLYDVTGKVMSHAPVEYEKVSKQIETIR